MTKLDKLIVGTIVGALVIVALSALFSVKKEIVGYQTLDTYNISSTEWTAVGSTTSLTISTKNADKVSLSIDSTPNGATSGVNWVTYFSDDATTWYQESVASSSYDGAYVQEAGVTHKWLPGTSRAYLKTDHTNISSNYMKVTFTAVGATSTIAVKAVTQQTTQ